LSWMWQTRLIMTKMKPRCTLLGKLLARRLLSMEILLMALQERHANALRSCRE
jgi:hypothetical protein